MYFRAADRAVGKYLYILKTASDVVWSGLSIPGGWLG